MGIKETRLFWLWCVWSAWVVGGGCDSVEPCDVVNCRAPKSCVDGRCECASPAMVCAGVCADVAKDASNCGGCGKACAAGELCVRGVCAPNCPVSQVACDGQCVSLERDPLHCGGCGKACAPTQPCVGGKCVWACPPSQAGCGDLCVSLERDAQHCGSCGKNCGAAEACVGGVCGCVEPFLRCDAACVDSRADGRHCGGCGKACESGTVCSEGMCVASCPQATSAVCLGGCVDVETNVLHCGGCGKACAAGLSCISGICGCTGGMVLCDGRCVDMKTDRLHCGGCGKACQGGALCSEGTCVISCPQATSTVCLGGCVDVQTNVLHCGGCGKACASGLSCIRGVCGCTGGTVLCGGRCVDVKTDVLHCGGCGKACASGLSCLSGVCGCKGEAVLCRGQCVDVKSDGRHCGGCGRACGGGMGCIEGICRKLYDEELIQAGTFTMGSPTNEMGRDPNETPYPATLSRSFFIGKYEVTQDEFQKWMGYNPSFFKSCGGNCPVEQVNWHEAAAFANVLSRASSLYECFDCTGSGAGVTCAVKAVYAGSDYYACVGYRLPTEAEWEYAYRAGTTTAFHNGGIVNRSCSDPNMEAIGWYCGNAQATTHPVGTKKPNAWGLYDMSGNVREWAADWYVVEYPKQATTDPAGAATGTTRVVRSGGWNNEANIQRAANRFHFEPKFRSDSLGFRIVRSSP